MLNVVQLFTYTDINMQTRSLAVYFVNTSEAENKVLSSFSRAEIKINLSRTSFYYEGSVFFFKV